MTSGGDCVLRHVMAATTEGNKFLVLERARLVGVGSVDHLLELALAEELAHLFENLLQFEPVYRTVTVLVEHGEHTPHFGLTINKNKQKEKKLALVWHESDGSVEK